MKGESERLPESPENFKAEAAGDKGSQRVLEQCNHRPETLAWIEDRKDRKSVSQHALPQCGSATSFSVGVGGAQTKAKRLRAGETRGKHTGTALAQG